MLVNDLYLEDFRNYTEQITKFSNGLNVVTGRNAQGKTNLVEAIFYLGVGRSFRPAVDKELISFGRERAYIRANVLSYEREQTLEARLFHGQRREFRVNDVKIKNLSELTGRLTVVVFCPDDLNIIKSGAAVKRKLLDHCLSQLRPGYRLALTEFNRLYTQKTRILRNHHTKPDLLGMLDDYNQLLAQQSARLIYYRSAFSEILAEKAAKIHSEFSGNAEELRIQYKTVADMDVKGQKPEQILPQLLEHQKMHRQAEIMSGMCLSGAHKDDLEVEINGKSARKYASQGQSRTAAVSIKLAERDLHFDDRGEYPVLLLDDVLSELDAERQHFILGRIKLGQVIITATDDTPTTDGNLTLRVENGRIL